MRLHSALAGTVTTRIPRTLSFPTLPFSILHLTVPCILYLYHLGQQNSGLLEIPLLCFPLNLFKAIKSIKDSAPRPHPEPLDATERPLLVGIYSAASHLPL